jgi:ribonuclease P protein component
LIARLRGREAFRRLRRRGVRYRVEPLWCSFVHDPDVTPPRVGFAIGRRVGTAVQRNRLRRRLRALLREQPIPPGLLLIGAEAPTVELTFDELRCTLRGLLRRLPAVP